MAKPIVDGLERSLAGRAEVLRVNAMTQIGAMLVRKYNIRAVPTILVFDGAGQVLYTQAGLPNQGAIRAAVAQALPE